MFLACLAPVNDAFVIQEKLAPGINSRLLFNTKRVFRLFTMDVPPIQDTLMYNSTNMSTEASTWRIFDNEV